MSDPNPNDMHPITGNQRNESAECPEQIEADCVWLEVTDQLSGKTFRRQLPLHYRENSSGILLSGETPTGTPTQIAFLSAAAIDKIRDVLGQGPDSPRCDHPD